MLNRIRYFLKSPYFGTSEIEEPINWESDEKELMRSDKHAGIVKNISNNMQFHGQGKELVDSAYEIAGIKADVKIERQVRNDENDIWEVDYFGWLDFATYKSSDTVSELKVNENKFFKTIESRFKDKFELDRLTDVKGNPIPALSYVDLELDGREIERNSEFSQNMGILTSELESPEVIKYYWIPLKTIFKSNDVIQAFLFQKSETTNVINNLSSLIDTNNLNVTQRINPSLGKMFYYPAVNEGSFEMNFSGNFFTQKLSGGTAVSGDNVVFQIKLTKYNENEGVFTVVEDLIDYSFGYDFDQIHNLNFTAQTTIEKGDCFAFYFFNRSRVSSSFISTQTTASNLLFTIKEVSESVLTTCKALTVNTAIDRLLHIITGKQTYQSTVLNSFWKDLLITNGFLIRQIPEKSITLSLEDVLTGLGVIDDIDWIIENEQVFVERLDFVYRNTILNIGTLANKNEETIPNLHYSKIAIGYDFNGEYEEVVGLDENNIKNEYTTPIDNQDEPIELISKVLADSYGITLAQLKPFETNPKLDTKYDKNNYFIDAKISENKYVVRHWQDDFDNAPTGIFSPDTAFNLRLSPFNCLIRKGRFLSVGFQKFQSERLIYSSTEGNSQLVTVYPERTNELVSILERPYHLPELITGTIELSFSEYTNIIRNKYNLLTFTDRNGNVGRGYLKSVKPNGNTAEITIFKVK
jgi:hypothetical protein